MGAWIGHHWPAWVASLLVSAALLGAPVAHALFTSASAGGPMKVSTGSVAPAGSPKAAQVNCNTKRAPEVKIEWSASSSEDVTGYTVERAANGSGSFSAIATLGAAQRSYTDSGLAYSTTYEYRVAAAVHSWSATSAVVSVQTLSRYCTGG